MNKTIIENTRQEQKRTIELVRKWGGSASDAVLDPSCKHFSIPDVKGIIGYRIKSSCAIVYGDPICSPEDIQSLTSAFHRHCERNKWTVIYVIASPKFAAWASDRLCPISIVCAEEQYLDPYDDPRAREGVHAQLVRRKVRHAEHAGVAVREYLVNDPSIEDDIERVGTSWLESRKGPQVYISHVRLFDNRFGKRWFYAVHNNKIIGVLILNKLQAYEGWLFNHLMFTSNAPGGTPESLVISALDKIRSEGCHYATFGPVPLQNIGAISGLNSFYVWSARYAYRFLKRAFALEGRRHFWGKFHPQSQPSYILISSPRITIRTLAALKSALNASLA